jgi:uncharacterized membrane protein YagU involved in acid resistance
MSARTVIRSLARGAVGAMAMTGVRRVTTGVGLVEKPPPERIVHEGFPDLLAQVPSDYRDEVIEVAHWAYGAVAGAAFGVLPAGVRRHVWSGPVYGLAIWAAFEAGLAPVVLGLEESRRRPIRERLTIAADHVLYGLVLAARPRADLAP